MGLTNATGESDLRNYGSSPRTWGLLRKLPQCSIFSRFIPTHVGLTTKPKQTDRPHPVHPHARGAYYHEQYADVNREWFIPTHVGLTCVHPYTPQICNRFIPTHVGLTVIFVAKDLCFRGSSPRTWGLRAARRAAPNASGSSPRTWGLRADAGDTSQSCEVHPHARGAYEVSERDVADEAGSSPRTWGLRWALTLCRSGARFIPTHVGLTLSTVLDNGKINGSSPRTWGLH